jgi:hypothetical protein
MAGNSTLTPTQLHEHWYVFGESELGKLEVQEVTTEKGEVFIFLHFTTDSWGKSFFKEMKELFPQILQEFKGKGFDVIFATTQNPKSIKFWNMIKKCYTVVQLDDNAWLGSWLTKD